MRQREGRAALAARASDGPRVRVAALMRMDGKVVTVRHRAGASVYHLLPGGGVDYRETIAEALLREIREETGLEAELGDPLFISDTIDPNGTRHLINITFEARVVGGAITDTPNDRRVEAVDLIDPVNLASLDLRPPIAEVLIEYLSEKNAQGAAVDQSRTRYLGSLFTEGKR